MSRIHLKNILTLRPTPVVAGDHVHVIEEIVAELVSGIGFWEPTADSSDSDLLFHYRVGKESSIIIFHGCKFVGHLNEGKIIENFIN